MTGPGLVPVLGADQAPGSLGLATVMRGFLAVVLLALAVLLLVVVVHRLTAGVLDARRERRVRAARPLLLEVLADDSPEPAGLATLAALPERRWRVLEPTVVSMLGKVRGAARGSLVDLLASRGTLERAVRGTRSRSWVRRCRAAEMLGAARHGGYLPALVPLLDDRRGEVRQVAARAMGRIGGRDAAGPLLDAAGGARALPAREVASALVLLEPAATPTLVGAAAEARDSQVRSLAVEVLGLRGAVEAAGVLVRLLEEDPETEVRIRAARALGRIGVRASAAPLAAAASAQSAELRAVAARALGQLGAAEGVDALVRGLSDPWHRVASNAAESLAALGGPGLAALRRVADTGDEGDEADEAAAGYAEQALAVAAVDQGALDRTGG